MAANRALLVVFCFFSCGFVFGNDELKTLDDTTFEHLTQAATGATTGDWLIVFLNPRYSSYKKLENLFIKIQKKFEHKLNVAKVLPSSSRLTVKRFEITKWPSVMLFHHGRQYYYTSEHKEASLTKFVETFKKFPNRKVPMPITMFDVMIEDLADDVKHIIHIRKNAAIVIFCSGILFGVIILQVLKCIFVGSRDEVEAKNIQCKKDD